MTGRRRAIRGVSHRLGPWHVEWGLVLLKNALFHLGCLGSEDRYLRLKGRLVLQAARLGAYERAYLALLPQLVRPASDAVDVGANVGVYTHAIARALGPRGRLLAFEPVPQVASALEESCRSLGSVAVVREALSDVSRAAVPFRIPRLPGGVPEPALARFEADAGADDRLSAGVVRVRAARLDDHLGTLRDLSFIKADLEGCEAAFLRGAAVTVRRFRPILQLESAGVRREEQAVREWLTEMEYELYTLNRKRLAPAAPGSRLSLNIYLIPREAAPRLPRELFVAAPGNRRDEAARAGGADA